MDVRLDAAPDSSAAASVATLAMDPGRIGASSIASCSLASTRPEGSAISR
jgi:hypothetical protein